MATRRRPFSGKPITKPMPPAPPAPQAPVNTLPSNTTTPINTAKQFTVANNDAPRVTDNDSPALLVVLSCSKGYLEVLESSKVVITGNKTSKVTLSGSPENINSLLDGLWYVPFLDLSGVDTIYFRTTDGVLIDVDSFEVNITGAAPPPPAPGPAPVNTVPATQSLNTSNATSVTFSAINGNAITVADTDSPVVTTTASCNVGVLKINNLTTGATVLNNNTGAVQITGTPVQVTSALDGSQYFPPAGFTGTAVITINSTDGTSSDIDTVNVTVTSSAPPPPPPPPPSPPFYPFGARLDLVGGKYPNGIVVSDRSAASLDSDLRNRYLQWKAARVYNVPAVSGAKAVKFTDAPYPNTSNALTVSEGMGYGMLLAVLFEDQVTFDGLLKLVRARPAYSIPGGFANANLYLMDWKLGPNGESSDNYGGGWNAMDGDEDIAQALLMADRQWKNTNTTWNYLLEAQRTIAALKAWNFKADGTTKGLAQGDISRTSDYMFGHFRSFAQATNDTFWTDQVIPRCKAINERCQLTFSAANGGPAAIVPDFVVNTGGELAGQAYTSPNVTNIAAAFGVGGTYGSGTNNYVPCPGGRADFVATEMHYYANAQRCPQRWGNDLIFSGDAGLKTQTNRLINFVKTNTGGNPANTPIGYRLNAGLLGPQGGGLSMGNAWPPRGMVAGFACGAQCDAAHQSYINTCYTWMMNNFTVAYYDCELMLMAMVALSGNWWTYPGAPVQSATITNNVPTAQTTAISTPKNFRQSSGNLVSVAYDGTKSLTAALTVLHGTLSMGSFVAGASSATFTQPAGSISIVDHGAVAGGPNCRTAIHAAVAAAQSTVTKTVWVPPGVWHWTGGVLNINGVKLVGAGYLNTTLFADDLTNCSCFLQGSGAGVEQMKLTNNTTARVPNWERTKVFIGGNVTGWTVKNCWIENSPAASIHSDNPGSGSPSNGYIGFNTIVNSMSDSIHLTGSTSNVLVEYNDISSSGDDGVACASYTGYGTPVKFVTARHNVIKNNDWGRGMSVLGGEDIYYFNNYIEGNASGFAGMYIAAEDNASWQFFAAKRVKFELNTVKNCGSNSTGHGAITCYSDGLYTNDDIWFLRNDIIFTTDTTRKGHWLFGPQTNVKLEKYRYGGTGTAVANDGGGTVITLNEAYTSGAIGYTAGTGETDPATYGTITGNGTAAVSVAGTLAQVNNALGLLTYTPTTAYSGNDTLSLTTTDGTVSDTDNVSITVGSAPPPPPPPDPGDDGEDILNKYFVTNGNQGAWLDPTPISQFQTLASGGSDLTAYGNLCGLWKDRSGRNHHAVESDINSRPTANNDRLGPHLTRYDPMVIQGAGGSTQKMYACIVIENFVNAYYGTYLCNDTGTNPAGFRLYHNSDESGQPTWEGAPAPLGDIILSVGNGTVWTTIRGFSMGAGGDTPTGAPPYTQFTGARAIEIWIDAGTMNLRINKGNTISAAIPGGVMAAGRANVELGAIFEDAADWIGTHDYQIIMIKDDCPSSEERDLIVEWAGAKAGLAL